MRIGYLECFSGISGDMLLGALVDAGVPFSLLEESVTALNVGARLEMRKVSRGGIAGTKVDVICPGEEGHAHEHPHTHEHSHTHTREQVHTHDHPHTHGNSHSHTHDHPHDHGSEAMHSHSHALPHRHEHVHGASHEHRSLSAILRIIRGASLSESVKERAVRAFEMLGHAEAAIHSVPVETVHFHEVGAVDTIVDIVCAAVGCEWLGVDRWMASPLNVGSGTVECAHGRLPVPAPATLALLGDAPVYAAGPAMERVTPTGAVVLRMLDVSYGTLPTMRVQRTGYGAGGRETVGHPNLLRLLVGEEQAAESGAESLAVIETVIDDSTPQVLAYVSELLLEAGAWDVYRVPVQMKKGRTGVQLTVLCKPDLLATLRELIFRETSTIGLHWRLESKMALAREFAKVQTQWGEVSIKIARWPGGGIANAAPEYEDCRRIAMEHGVPLKQVMAEAMRSYAVAKEEG